MTVFPDIPKELYRFVEGDSAMIYTVTSSDEAQVYDAGFGNETYAPIAIGRTEAQGKGEMARQNIVITFGIDNETAKRWFVTSLDFPLVVTVFSVDDGDVEIEWKGRLTSVSPKKATIEFTFESVFTSMRRMGLRQRYQKTCPHSLYGQGCRLDKEDFAISGHVSAVLNSTVTFPDAASYADGWFNAGIFEDQDGNLRFILSHVGSTLVLIRPMNTLIDYVAAHGYTGLTCRIFPGCNRTTQNCNDKFANILNFGGFPFMPTKNPFATKSIV